MVKSDGFLLPIPLLMTFLTTLKNVKEPGGEGFGHLPLTGEELSAPGQTHLPFDISESSGHWHLPSTIDAPSGHFIGFGFGWIEHLLFLGDEPSGQTHLPFISSEPPGQDGSRPLE
jgi:hypothetical protein